MSKRRITAFLALTAAAAAALFATFALADTTTVKDAKRETAALRKNPRVDIIRASAGHHGELLQHKVVVRKKIKRSKRRERPLIGINTRGGPSSDPEYLVFGHSIFKNPKKGKPVKIGGAKLKSKRRTWTYRFDPAAFPGKLGRYGWVAFTTTRRAFDVVPSTAYVIHKP